MATRRITYSPADISFIHSLAPIWRDHSRNHSQSRRRSTIDESCQDNQGSSRNRRDQSAPRSKDDRYSRPITPMAGIVKTDEHEAVKSSSEAKRVSFGRSQSQGNRSNNDVNSITACHPLRSLRDSPHWPPPPPPRNSVSNRSREKKDLSKVLKSPQVAKLPFPTVSDVRTHSRPRCPGQRRHSMLQMEEPGDTGIEPSTGCVPPPPPFLNRRRSDGDGHIFISNHQEFKEHSHVGSRLDYVLGDSPRCLSHMIIESCPQAALERVSCLNIHDFAFVKRSNGLWSYAILAHRYVDINNEEHMIFVLNEVGCTKTVKKGQWGKCVSCAAMIGIEDHVPKTISFNKDDYSLISSI